MALVTPSKCRLRRCGAPEKANTNGSDTMASGRPTGSVSAPSAHILALVCQAFGARFPPLLRGRTPSISAFDFVSTSSEEKCLVGRPPIHRMWPALIHSMLTVLNPGILSTRFAVPFRILANFVNALIIDPHSLVDSFRGTSD